MKKISLKNIKKPNISFKRKNKEPKDKNKKMNPNKRNIIFMILVSIGIFIISAILIFVLFIIITAPKFEANELYNRESSVLYAKDGTEFAKLGAENRELATYDELPQVLIDAIIATEDARFFQHSGFDVARFAKASFGQLTGDSSAGGGSTLTMQVSKNTFTSTEARGLQGLIRKFTDIYISVFKIERNYTKEEIIEFYVNAPWLGNRSYGVEQASQGYFGKSVKDLNLSEAALIAGMFQAPAAYNPYQYPENAAKRRDTVLNLMVRHGYITEEEKEEATSITIESMLIGSKGLTQNPYQAFIDTVVEEVIDRTGNDPAYVPMNIYTTMETSSQDVINNLMNGKYYKFVNDEVQTAVALIDTKDGSIRGIGAGRNRTGERTLNLATSRKHPGSTAKPIFDYGPFIEYNNGSSYSLFFDEPMTYSNGANIRNFDGKFQGLITMKTALVGSRNIPALQAFQAVDKDLISDFVHSLGVDYGDTLYESASVGGFDGMSPLELAAAYSTFARGGYYIEPYSYTKIEYRQTGDTVEQKPKRVKVMSEETAYIMNYILTAAGAAGVGGPIKVSGTDVAAKSGTTTYDEATLKAKKYPSDASPDNWIAAYTPDYSMSIWYGYDYAKEGRYIRSIPGYNARVKISSELGNRIFKKNSKFDIPDGVVKKTVEMGTIPPLLASDNTPSNLKTTEYFKKGYEPTETSSRFDTLSNPTNGTWTAYGNQVTISWDKVKTPDAINNDYLQKYFNSGYGKWATKYYNQRLTYNTNNMGNIGYQIYLKNPTGELTNLGYTTNSSYSYTVLDASTYSFVVKSAYSIYKTNMSSGLTISSSSSGNANVDPNIPTPNNNISNITLNGNAEDTVSKSIGFYTDIENPVTVYSNSVNITSSCEITASYFRIGNSTPLAGINLEEAGNYKIVYEIKYKVNGNIVDTRSTSRLITIT